MRLFGSLIVFVLFLEIAQAFPSPASRHAVLERQHQLECSLNDYDFDQANSMATYDFSYSIIDRFSVGCCLRQGDMHGFVEDFFEGKRFKFLQPSHGSVKEYANGTVVVQRTIVAINKAQLSDVSAYNMKFYWSPQGKKGCEWKLIYVDGNSLQCPSFQPEIDSCVPFDEALAKVAFLQARINSCAAGSDTSLDVPGVQTSNKLCLNIPGCCITPYQVASSMLFLAACQPVAPPLEPARYGEPRIVSVSDNGVEMVIRSPVTGITANDNYVVEYDFSKDIGGDYQYVMVRLLLDICPNYQSYPLCFNGNC